MTDMAHAPVPEAIAGVLRDFLIELADDALAWRTRNDPYYCGDCLAACQCGDCAADTARAAAYEKLLQAAEQAPGDPLAAFTAAILAETSRP